ncbi:OmpH family outer membrane protein [Leeia sp.]|uniref:OmpH family outer membrane protein n=1 Tax=Leeia sp. TaxID=2884678 RepID=UPI0035ADD8AF
MSKFSKVMGGLLALAVATGAAAETKIGVFSLERIVQAVSNQKDDKKIKEEFARRQAELQKMESQAKDMQADLEKNEATMSEADKTKKQKALRDLSTQFQRKLREFREDVSAKQAEDESRTGELLRKAIKQLASTEKYDLIVQGDELPYYGPQVDVTDKLLKMLGAK